MNKRKKILKSKYEDTFKFSQWSGSQELAKFNLAQENISSGN